MDKVGWLPVAFAGVVVFSLVRSAVAQPIPAPGAVPGASTSAPARSHLASLDSLPPEPLPPLDVTVHNHDGFYIRVAGGVGYVDDSISIQSSGIAAYPMGEGASAKSVGGALMEEGMLGGTVVDGLVLGGGFTSVRTLRPMYLKLTWKGRTRGTSDESFEFYALGAFADWYPDPSDGFHLRAFVGRAWLDGTSFVRAQTQGDFYVSPVMATGWALAGALGYEWWTDPQGSVGVMATLMYSSTHFDRPSASADVVFVPALLATGTYQ